MDIDKFKELFEQYTNFENNKFHPFVKIAGKPIIGNNVNIGFFSEINAKNSKIEIGDNCDIASFVSINSADSHNKCLDENNDIVHVHSHMPASFYPDQSSAVRIEIDQNQTFVFPT